ncbi:hypothetical protein ABK040_014782 [Willaertia magna]
MPFFPPSISPGPNLIDLENAPVTNWTPDNVKYWLKVNHYDKDTIKKIVKHRFDGVSLLNFTAVENLIEIGVARGSALSVYNRIQEVLQKQKMTTASPSTPTNNNNTSFDPNPTIPIDEDIEELKELAEDIVNPKDATKAPLNEQSSHQQQQTPASHQPQPQFISNASKSTLKTSFNLVPEAPSWDLSKLNQSQLEKFNKALIKVKAVMNQYDEKLVIETCQNLVFAERFRYKYLNPSRLPIYSSSLRKSSIDKPSNACLKIKLVITEMSDAALSRLARRFVTKISPTIHQMKYGMFHTALIIGPWYIEWGDSSIAITRHRSSSKAVLAVDVCKVTGLDNVANTIDRLASLCAHWNSEKEYDNKTCNCQHFVNAVLEYLQISNYLESNIKGTVKTYIENLKTNGVCSMSYPLEPQIKELMRNTPTSDELRKYIYNGYIIFHSHRILDEFVKIIQRHKPLYFEGIGKYDFALLKAFDRAFWLRTQSSKEGSNDLFKPLENGERCLCPFNTLPEDINSIVGNDYELEGICVPFPIPK